MAIHDDDITELQMLEVLRNAENLGYQKLFKNNVEIKGLSKNHYSICLNAIMMISKDIIF
jgi:hypothetical protein